MAFFFNKIRNFNFFKLGKVCFFISLTLIAISLSLIFFKGINLGADFVGGTVVEFKVLNNTYDASKIKNFLEKKDIKGVESNIADSDFVVLKVKMQNEKGDADLIKGAIKELYSDEEVYFRKIDFLGPQASRELLKNGIISVLLSFAAIMLYMWFRFEFIFGLGGVVLLLHDVIIVLGICSIFCLELNFSFVAAILTIIGYSINDSVVIYDKIREQIKKSNNRINIEKVVNTSVLLTMKRTCYTSITTLAAVFALVIFGGSVIRNFAWAVFAGTIIGTYSSIMIAPLFLLFRKKNC